MKKAQSQQIQAYLQLLMLIAIIIVINFIAQFYHERLDLTSDNRYTLSEQTIEKLENLDDVIFVRVFLGEGLPSGFRKLKTSTRELLNEMKAYAGENLEYEFVDPSKIEDPDKRRKRYQQLADKGLNPVNLQVRKDQGSSQKLIFPGAMVYYQNNSIPLQILQDQRGRNPQRVIHNSIMTLEYGFMNTLRKLKSGEKHDIAFITGHGELGEKATQDIRENLSNYYNVKRLNLPEFKVGALREFDLAVIAKPTQAFSELEKFKIDQFIMRGGKVLWLVENLQAEMDMLNTQGVGMTKPYELNLRDQLFKYGVRINNDLVQDRQSHVVPVVRNRTQGQQQRNFLPWPFYPIVSPKNPHPITSNLNSIWYRFTNTIDTVRSEGVDKTILLHSSNQSRVMHHPVRINMQQIRQKMRQKRLFRSGPQNLGVLLEGQFQSVFTNRVPSSILEGGDYGKMKETSPENRMIVIPDGDIIRNQYSSMKDKAFELGKDRFVKTTFANKEFMLNCIDYLMDESDLMKLRTKDFSMRLLNKSKAEDQKLLWQIINMGGPVVLVILFGFGYNLVRRYRFAR